MNGFEVSPFIWDWLKSQLPGTPETLSPFMWDLDLENCHRIGGTEHFKCFGNYFSTIFIG